MICFCNGNCNFTSKVGGRFVPLLTWTKFCFKTTSTHSQLINSSHLFTLCLLYIMIDFYIYFTSFIQRIPLLVRLKCVESPDQLNILCCCLLFCDFLLFSWEISKIVRQMSFHVLDFFIIQLVTSINYLRIPWSWSLI